MSKNFVYKVVKQSFYSKDAFCSILSKNVMVYWLNNTTLNYNEPMFAFTELESALNFYTQWENNSSKILKCKFVQSQFNPKCIISYNAQVDDIKLFWKLIKQQSYDYNSWSNVPENTIFCSEITPVEITQ